MSTVLFSCRRHENPSTSQPSTPKAKNMPSAVADQGKPSTQPSARKAATEPLPKADVYLYKDRAHLNEECLYVIVHCPGGFLREGEVNRCSADKDGNIPLDFCVLSRYRKPIFIQCTPSPLSTYEVNAEDSKGGETFLASGVNSQIVGPGVPRFRLIGCADFERYTDMIPTWDGFGFEESIPVRGAGASEAGVIDLELNLEFLLIKIGDQEFKGGDLRCHFKLKIE